MFRKRNVQLTKRFAKFVPTSAKVVIGQNVGDHFTSVHDAVQIGIVNGNATNVCNNVCCLSQKRFAVFVNGFAPFVAFCNCWNFCVHDCLCEWWTPVHFERGRCLFDYACKDLIARKYANHARSEMCFVAACFACSVYNAEIFSSVVVLLFKIEAMVL